MKLRKIRQAVAIDPQRKMSFDPAWASHFSDPAWVAIELYSRVVFPLQLLVEFPDLPYIPFEQQQPVDCTAADVVCPLSTCSPGRL